MAPLGPVVRDVWHLLTFRLGADRFAAFGRGHLIVGLVVTWMAGVGRYWDAPRAHLLQHAGLGSLIYVVVLAALLWCVVRPMTRNGDCGYNNLLVFVCLTSPPALLYAIPVERFVPVALAAEINVWFLAVVALWRVALLLFYLRRAVGLSIRACVIGLVLPVAAIIMLLAALNLEHAAFEIMGGLREEQRTSADAAYGVVLMLGVLSVPVFIVALVAWLFVVGRTWRERRRTRAPEVKTTAPDEPGRS